MPVTINGTTGITTPTYNGNTTAEYLVPVTAFKNRIINGGMVIDQRNAGASVTANDAVFIVDRWKMEVTQSSKLTGQQNAGSVTPPPGFINYLGLTSSSSFSVAASDYFCVDQIIEGLNIADLGWGTADAKTIILSFWVRSSLTGTFGGTISNSASNRSYPFTYTISTANTWEQKSVTVAGDTSGTWLTTNGVGLRLRFGLGAGATYSGTAGSWSGSTFLSATGAVSVVGTNGATFYITGVQLEVGSTATSFDYRPYGTELQLCQRYYQAFYGNGGVSLIGRTNAGTGQGAWLSLTLPVTMRAAPTGTRVGTWQITNLNAQPTVNTTTVNNVALSATITSGGDAFFYTDSTAVGFTLSSEL